MADSTRDIPLSISLDKSKAKAQGESFRRDMQTLNKGLADDSRAASASEAEAYKRAQADREKAARARADSELAYQRRVYENENVNLRALKSARSSYEADAAKGFGEVAAKGKAGFGAVALAVGGVGLALRAVHGLAVGLGAELARVGERSKQLSESFARDRDSLRELAQLRGEPAGDEFTLKVAGEAREALQTKDEARKFQTEFMNSGAQFEGKTISPEQFARFRQLSGAFATAKQVGPAEGGNLAGSFLGFRDYTKLPKGKQAEAGLADMAASFAVLQRGKGDTSVLTGQMSQTAAAALNPSDETAGAFRSATEVATAISMAAEANPSTAAEQVRAATRGLRDFENPMVREAGIKPQDSFLEAVRKLAPVVARRRKQGPAGTTTLDVLKQGGFDARLETEAIAVQLNRGVAGGGYEDRARVAAEGGTAAAGRGVIDQFRQGKVGAHREAEADQALAEAERAAKNSELTILRKQALARLTREERIDTNATGIQDFLSQKASFGAIGSAEQKRIDDEVQRSLQVRSGGTLDTASLALTPEGRERELRGQVDLMKRRGLNPLLAAEGEENVIDRREGVVIKEGEGGFLDGVFGRERKRPATFGARPPAAAGPGAPGAGPQPNGMDLSRRENVAATNPNDPAEVARLLRSIDSKLGPAVPRPLVEAPRAQRR